MMEEVVRSLALLGGTVALIVPTIAAAVNVTRLMRTSGDHLVVRVDNKLFVIDVNAIDNTTVAEIDDATQAVERRVEARALGA